MVVASGLGMSEIVKKYQLSHSSVMIPSRVHILVVKMLFISV